MQTTDSRGVTYEVTNKQGTVKRVSPRPVDIKRATRKAKKEASKCGL